MHHTHHLVTEDEAADLLKVKPSTLRRWRYSGGGPRFRKIGRLVRYHIGDLQAFVAEASRPSTNHISQ